MQNLEQEQKITGKYLNESIYYSAKKASQQQLEDDDSRLAHLLADQEYAAAVEHKR
jgi:hypothetical protein